MAGEKTEKATPKRKQDERKKGNIFQSKDLTSILALVAIFYFLRAYMPTMLNYLKAFLIRMIDISNEMESVSMLKINEVYLEILLVLAITALPALLVAMLVNVVLSGAQTRFLFSSELLKFKWDKLDPISGFKRMFSVRSIVELIKNLIKVIGLLVIVYVVLAPKIGRIPIMMELEFSQVLAFLVQNIMNLVLYVGVAFLFVGLADYGYQWYDYEKKLRMSKQDIKDEYKQQEGDPQIKGKIRQKQQQMAQKRMMQEVKNADVIIKNPTHVAIAIQYKPTLQRAPKVIAKGIDSLALRIIEEANKHQIVTVENIPLARALYAAVELEDEVPEEYYEAIAQVLAYVYQIRQKGE